MLTTLANTLLNPHVYLDTLLIIGGIGGTLGREEKHWFLLGSVIASFVWFIGLDYAYKKRIPFFENSNTWVIRFCHGCSDVLGCHRFGRFCLSEFICMSLV